MIWTNDDTKRDFGNLTSNEGLKKVVEASEVKGKKGPLPLPGDGSMDDVGGVLTLPGARKIRCDAAAR
jgi:hypothetical protein